jgi:flagellar hook-length control protein FliK
MPQLREVLAGAGINLGQANVGAQLPQQNSGTPQQFSDSRRFDNDNAILHGDSGHGTTSLPQPVRGGRGMVDLFA